MFDWLKPLLGLQPQPKAHAPAHSRQSLAPNLNPNESIAPRVMVLIHNPILENEGGRKLHQVMGWNDPDVLARQYIQDVREASWGYVNYQIVERMEIDGFPLKRDGFCYTDETYMRCWRNRSGFHAPDAVSYPDLLRQSGFAQKVVANQADELWLFAFPYAGYFESCMGGRGAIWCNGDVIPNTEHIDRKFVVMGFNYERGVGEMLEDLGHRAENIMAHVFRHTHREENLWQRFTQHDKTHSQAAACGNVHFAPNSRTDYDWGHNRAVRSSADDWLNYPNLTGETRLMNCDEWGNGDIRLHHLWWFKRFPHVAGTTAQGIQHNWWKHIVGLEL